MSTKDLFLILLKTEDDTLYLVPTSANGIPSFHIKSFKILIRSRVSFWFFLSLSLQAPQDLVPLLVCIYNQPVQIDSAVQIYHHIWYFSQDQS